MTTGIYSIINTTNGKIYIGSSINIERRWKQHKWALRKGAHHSPHLQRAWDIDGESAFLLTVLCECGVANMTAQEQLFIDAHKAADGSYGYNVCGVSKSRLGTKCSEESKARMSLAKKGRVSVTKDARRLISEALKGKSKSPETLERMRAAQRNRKPITEEARAKMSAASSSRQSKPESNAKRSAALKGKPKSAETIAKIRASRQAGIAKRKAESSSQPDNAA
jgi:group I intron endonuclease